MRCGSDYHFCRTACAFANSRFFVVFEIEPRLCDRDIIKVTRRRARPQLAPTALARSTPNVRGAEGDVVHPPSQPRVRARDERPRLVRLGPRRVRAARRVFVAPSLRRGRKAPPAAAVARRGVAARGESSVAAPAFAQPRGVPHTRGRRGRPRVRGRGRREQRLPRRAHVVASVRPDEGNRDGRPNE